MGERDRGREWRKENRKEERCLDKSLGMKFFLIYWILWFN